jgi:hypothetical protein
MSTLMNSLSSADYVAIALAVGGLAAVLWEIAVKHPRSFLDMLADTRSFAEAAVPAPSVSQAPASADARPRLVHVAPAAVEEHRLAA